MTIVAIFYKKWEKGTSSHRGLRLLNMGSIAFDTLAYVKRLKAAGVPESQAEAQAETFVEIIEGRLATRVDLRRTESVLRKDLEQIRSDLKKDLEQIRSDSEKEHKQIRFDSAKEHAKTKLEIIKWTAGMLLAQTAIIATLVKLL